MVVQRGGTVNILTAEYQTNGGTKKSTLNIITVEGTVNIITVE